MKTLAIFSPNQNAYSETFIQAHKRLPFTIKFYYNGLLPTQLENTPTLIHFSLKERIEKKIKKQFSLREYALLYSLKREKVNCVLAEYGTVACEVLKVVKHLQLPLIVHFHGYDTSVKYILEHYKERYKEVFAYAQKVVVVSVKMKQDLANMGCPQDKLILATYGPSDDFFQTRPQYHSLQFISVGRFVEKKAPYLSILSFRKVVDRFPGAKLVMVGDGELLTTCKKLANGLGLGKNIEFKGVQSPGEIQLLFGESIAFVQHSVTAENGDSEGTPVAILEAQAAGLPVISTYHAGIPDVVINNETGLLVEEYDVEGMANNMLRLLEENGLAKKLGENGRERVKENFTMEKHLMTIETVIDKVMNN